MELKPTIENDEDLRQFLISQGLGFCAEGVIALAQPALTGPMQLGGAPRLDPGQKWPQARVPGSILGRRRSLPFVAQLDFSMLSIAAPEGPFPDKGLVAFFWDFDTAVNPAVLRDRPAAPDAGWCVLQSSKSAVPRELPDDIPDVCRYPQFDVASQRELTLPGMAHDQYNEIENLWSDPDQDQDDPDQDEDVDTEDIYINSVLDSTTHDYQVLGYPNFIQGDEKRTGEVLLLQLTEALSDEDYAWAGIHLYFLIDEQHLKAGRLDQVRLVTQR